MCKSVSRVAFAMLLLSGFVLNSEAQMFEDSLGIEESNESALGTAVQKPAVKTTAPTVPAKAATASTTQKSSNKNMQEKDKDADVPASMKPTLDGTERGKVLINAVVSDKEQAKRLDEGSIFIFYRDFKINRMMNNRITCDVTFVVLTTLNRKISNLSFKLKWPGMLTSLSYDDVAPNTETIYKYTLLGDGCYTMDKTPNIIVNRCRVSGMTQQDCASRIKWIRKM